MSQTTATSAEEGSELGEPQSASGFSANDVLANHDGVALAEMVRHGDLTATEVIEAAIERANSVNGDINAIVATDFDRAREIADTNPAGAFAGLPIFIKNMTPIEGMVTGCGSDSMANSSPATEDARLVTMFRELGLVPLGTSTLPEYGLVCSTEFPEAAPTRNPWNLAHSAGGSSGGAAALVASGVLPFSHTADGGGSIRIPAAVCGLVGLKASRGRIVEPPAERLMPIKIGASGVVSRSVRDTCAFMAAAETFHHDPSLAPLGLVDRPLDRPLRIGVLDHPPIDVDLDSATLGTLSDTVALLESLGHQVEPIESPVTAQFADDFVLYWAVLASAIEHAGKKVIHPDFDASGLTRFSKGLSSHAKRNIAKVPGAMRRLRNSSTTVAEGFGRNDLILNPTLATLTPPIGHFDMTLSYEELMQRVFNWVCFTPLANASGTPAISLPMGHDEQTNLPIGMHFSARLGQERLLLELALQLEAARPFHSLA